MYGEGVTGSNPHRSGPDSDLGTEEDRKRIVALALMERERRAKARHKQLLEDNLAEFFKEAWKVLEPGRDLEWAWHYEMLAEYLRPVRDKLFKHTFGQDKLGIIINVPPRTAKSSFVTIAFPVWCWIVKPQMRFSCYSYSNELSTEHSIKRRKLIQSDWFQNLWGDRFSLASDQNLKTHFDNNKTGQMISTSVGGTATGKGGDVLILDDPLNPDQAASDTERPAVNKWIDNTLRSRMNDMANDIMIVVMQRLHEQDPTGYLMEQNGSGIIHVSIPLECEGVKTPDGLMPVHYEFPVSHRIVTMQPGQILMPAKFPSAAVEALKILRLTWAGQFQQRPAPLEGNMIKRKDFRFYGGLDSETGIVDAPLPARFDFTLVSCDAAFKDLDTSDFVCVLSVGVAGSRRYILDLVLKHLDAKATELEINRQRLNCRASVVLIEDKANGSAIIKSLRYKVPGIVAVNPEGGKMSRMFAASGEMQSNNWYMDRNAAWTEPFVTSMCTFPNAKNDDDVDAWTQACVWLQSHGYGLFELWKTQAQAELVTESVPLNRTLADAQKRDEGGFINGASTRALEAGSTGQDAMLGKASCECGNFNYAEYGDGHCFCAPCGRRWQIATSIVITRKGSRTIEGRAA
jgi:predicted phage terminase large subunit-like protein